MSEMIANTKPYWLITIETYDGVRSRHHNEILESREDVENYLNDFEEEFCVDEPVSILNHQVDAINLKQCFELKKQWKDDPKLKSEFENFALPDVSEGLSL